MDTDFLRREVLSAAIHDLPPLRYLKTNSQSHASSNVAPVVSPIYAHSSTSVTATWNLGNDLRRRRIQHRSAWYDPAGWPAQDMLLRTAQSPPTLAGNRYALKLSVCATLNQTRSFQTSQQSNCKLVGDGSPATSQASRCGRIPNDLHSVIGTRSTTRDTWWPSAAVHYLFSDTREPGFNLLWCQQLFGRCYQSWRLDVPAGHSGSIVPPHPPAPSPPCGEGV